MRGCSRRVDSLIRQARQKVLRAVEFDTSNLRYMRLFYQAFPMCDALRHELSWTHYRTLLRVGNDAARQWYMHEATTQGWSTRALERQIGTFYYERLLASRDPLVLPSEEELRQALDRERARLEEANRQTGDKSG